MASTPTVEWPSGEATACKAVHTGSIPVSTSKNDPARLAQRESASLTRKRSLVQSQYRAPSFTAVQARWDTRPAEDRRKRSGQPTRPPMLQAPAADVWTTPDTAMSMNGVCAVIAPDAIMECPP